jgi:hypothetical protein
VEKGVLGLCEGDCVLLEMERELCVDDVGNTPLASVVLGGSSSSTAQQVRCLGRRSSKGTSANTGDA